MELNENNGQRLRAVFELCDSEKKGYISVDHFVNLAREHFGAGEGDQDTEDIRRIVSVLDPEGDGKIHFKEFCQGVQQILELKSPCSPTMFINGPCPLPVPRPQVLGSEMLLYTQEEDANSSGTHETSELSTFNEYDIMTDDDQTPLAGNLDSTYFLGDLMIRPTLGSEDDQDSAFSGKSSETHEPRPEIEGTDEHKTYCDHRDDDASSGCESNSPSKHNRQGQVRTHRRVTSNGLASQLFRINPERRSSFGSDEIFDDIDGNFVELNDKVKKLEAQIFFLSDTQHKNDQRHSRLKDENTSLVERVHLLEEQLREVEYKSREVLTEEQRKHREVMSRTDKVKAQEIEILSTSLKHIQDEYTSLKEEAPRLRLENDRLKKENQHLEHQLQEVHQSLISLTQEHEDLQQHHHEGHADMEQERKVSTQLIDELSRELDDLRTKMEVSGATLSPQRANDLTRTQRKELEATIKRLKEENSRLKEEKEEMILSNHIQEGRSLVNSGMSLAEEIENLPKDELLKTIHEMQHENATLREYIDRITLRIIEKNPSILEIPIMLNASKKK